MKDEEQNMSIFKKWDVLLVDFFGEEEDKVKKRPALTISPEEYNKNKNNVIVIFITSNLEQNELYGDYKIKKWEEAGLVKPGKVQMNFCSVNKGKLKKLGELHETDIKNVEKNITKFFNF